MNQEFFRFPHTPHIAWLGKGSPRDDKVLNPADVENLLSGEILVEEKLDGANLGISVNAQGELQVQNRGQYLIEPYSGQFSRLGAWIKQHKYALLDHLEPSWILFGEWCAARHSISYQSLPDWFVLFDVYDRKHENFWSSDRRNRLAIALGLKTVPDLYRGRANLSQLIDLLNSSQSRYRNGPPEGIVIRRQSPEWCDARAKLVRAEFTQAIEEHWRGRNIEWNKVVHST